MNDNRCRQVPVVIVDGCRTPFLRSSGDFQDMTSYDLARLALKGLLGRTGIDVALVDRVILGTVISNVQTSNVAREALLGSGFSQRTPAFTVTQACISANVAISIGLDLIAAGRARVVVAGGTESMSDIPIRYAKPLRKKLIAAQRYKKAWHYFKFLRGLKLAHLLPEVPTISEFSTGRSMGQDCDRLAARIGVSREEQDAYALRSHQLASKATLNGLLAEEIEPVRPSPTFSNIDRDNGIRADSSAERLAKLRPAFVKPHGTVTAANSSFLTDGAAALLLMDEDSATGGGFKPKAYLRDYVFSAQDPGEELLLGPAYAVSRLLERTGLVLDDIDVFELHEAFAGQLLANLKCLASASFAREKLGLPKAAGMIPMEKLNTRGGSLSLGHPFGATGARLLTTAANRLIHEKGRYALVAACAAGAMGHAMLLEKYPA